MDRSHVVAAGFACAATLVPATAGARERAEAVLDYVAPTPACPDVARVRELVAAELGYDPFVDEAETTLRLHVEGSAPRFVARIVELPAGRSRELEASDCDQLLASAAFAAAMAIDPDEVVRAPAPPAPSTPRAPTPPVAPRVAPPEPPPRADATEPQGPAPTWTVSAGVKLGAGLVPGVSFGPHAGLSVRGENVSIAAEVQAFVPGSTRTSFADVSASIVRGAIVPCLRLPVSTWLAVSACGHASVGALLAEATAVTRSTPSTDVHVAFGPRAQVDVEPWSVVGFRAGGEVDVMATRVHLAVNDDGTRREAWVSPVVAGLGEISLLLRFQ